jgi:rubredoxin
MYTEITAFVTALGHATNIAKALINARDEVKRTSLAVEFNEAIIDVQTKQLAVVEKNQSLLAANEALNKQLAAYDRWEQEKSRYRLENVGAGAVVFALDPDKASGDALHWLCPHCYESRKKGFFQRHGKVFNHYKCDGCGSEIDALKGYPSA